MNAGHHAMLFRPGQDMVDGLHHAGLLLVQLRLAAQREREVVGPDIDRIQPLHREDIVEIVQRLPGFDHGKGEHRIVGMLGVIGAGI